MAHRRPPVLCLLVALLFISTSLVCADEAQQQTAQDEATGTNGQWSKKPEEQVRVTTSKNTSPPDISSTPATKRRDRGEEAVQPEDSALTYAEKKAESMEPCEASKEAEGSPRDDERTGACHDADSGSSGNQPNLSESKYAAALEDAEDRPPGEDVPQDSVIAEEEPLDGSAESTLEDFQSLKDILDGGASRRKEEDGRLSAFLSNALRALYSFFWYDFCEASAITPEPPTSSQQEVLAQASPAAGAKGQGKVTPKNKEPPCKHKGGRLSDWRAWREAGPKKPPAVIARLACLLRSAGYRIYPARPPAQFWPQGDVCTALCHSCECDYDENSTCGVARRAWKARTSPAVHALYTGLLHSRALCASAVLLGALRQNYVYRVVLCAPLVILLTMVTRCLYILMQLRRYLENSNTPAVNTRDCSNRHSEDEDLSPLERHRRQDHPLEDEALERCQVAHAFLAVRGDISLPCLLRTHRVLALSTPISTSSSLITWVSCHPRHLSPSVSEKKPRAGRCARCARLEILGAYNVDSTPLHAARSRRRAGRRHGILADSVRGLAKPIAFANGDVNTDEVRARETERKRRQWKTSDIDEVRVKSTDRIREYRWRAGNTDETRTKEAERKCL
ncbi:hypothetical protein HPB51_000420 [Rhipicephalus microplus]|uniref:Transmembrane protein n=1 Tax=Rhipicephalus microplus TaxID=6941 RepID=A0A9J6DRR8_RHIMP|nr:hypothetical protein HPB51_000420 [Rhipicephalus microplus]